MDNTTVGEDYRSSTASEVTLPKKMPDSWLKDIKTAVKESRVKLIITTILTSSLLTGLVTATANYYLESRKSMLQVKVEETKRNLQLYDALRDDVSKFSLALNTAVILLKSDSKTMDEKGRAAKLKSMVNDLADSMSAIQSTLARINDEDTKAIVQNVVQPLGPELAEMSTSSRIATHPVRNMLSECENILNQGVKNVMNHIEKKKLELYAEIR